MTRPYASFLRHCRRLGAAKRRVTVEHIESGERVAVASVAAAVEWICLHSRDATAGQTAVPDHEEATRIQQVGGNKAFSSDAARMRKPVPASGAREMGEERCR